MAFRSLRRQSLHYFARPAIGVCRSPVTSPAAWRGEDMRERNDWIITLNPADIAEIESALDCAGDIAMAQMRAEHLPLPTLGPRIAEWRDEVRSGRGFVLIRGVPVKRWPAARVERFFWGFGRHFGLPGAQNPQGDLLGHVRAERGDADSRYYRTSKSIAVHCDAADVVGLMCLEPARAGGESRIVSSITVFNELLGQRPDLIERLFAPLWFDTHGDGGIPAFPIAPCAWDGEHLRTFWQSDYFRTASRYSHVPELGKRERELLDCWDAIANDPANCLDMDLMPGDIQLLSNHTQLHARTGFTDWDDVARRRHLLRLWMSLPEPRSLANQLRAQRAYLGQLVVAARELLRAHRAQ